MRVTVVYGELKNLVVWSKTNAGQGSLYRSQHELIFVYKAGVGPHLNNVELGRHGRNRSNVWTYAGGNTFRAGEWPISQRTPRSSRSRWSPTQSAIVHGAGTWFSIHSWVSARPFSPLSGSAGELMASRLIPSMSMPPSGAGSQVTNCDAILEGTAQELR